MNAIEEHRFVVKSNQLIEARYRLEKGCYPDDPDYDNSICGGLDSVKWDIEKCRKADDDEERAACNITLANELLENLTFNDFKTLIGVNNLYVYGSVDGFRQKSEILNDTIYSHTIGKIGSKEWNGPLDVVRDLLGLSGGEFSGNWMRDSI